MCGIWAIFGNITLAFMDDYESCVGKLFPRGPEDIAVEEVFGVGFLGFTRLAINGLNPAGMQPMFLDGTAWVTNGEIYNWRALNTEYGLDCTTGSDCEIIGTLYKKFRSKGYSLASLFRAIDGVFATIIVDKASQRIVVARDPFGVRPLYSGVAAGKTYFSSEMKGFPEGITSVKAVEPGTYTEYDFHMRVITSERYHVISTLALPVFSGLEAATSAVRVALETAVKKRMMTERPVAALLSGGVDSSLIASLVARELRVAGAPPLKTFSIGMAGSSDLAHARRVADWIGSDHTEVVVKAAMMISAIPPVIHDIESFDTTTVRASVGNWLVAREVALKSDCKVVFNGDGSDEVFGSYLYFYNAPSDREYEEDVVRLLREIHSFDVLRSDRSISSHGLEPRTPFLDKAFVQTVLSIPLEFRRPSKSRPEKWLLRRAFDDGVTLPRDVLWRRKEAFSDGVSGQEKAWYQIAQESAAITVGEKMGTAFETPAGLVPTTPEMYLYRKLFEKDYAGLSAVNVPHFWMPRWSDAKDPSARTLGIY